jgi:hypothetical protein
MPLWHGETTGDGSRQGGDDLHRGAHINTAGAPPPGLAKAGHELDGTMAAIGCRRESFFGEGEA